MIGVIELALQAGGDLALHPLERLRLEPRLGDGEAKQFEGPRRVARERLHAAREEIAVGRKRKLDRLFFESAVEGIRIIGPAPSSSSPASSVATPGLPCRVLRGAAEKANSSATSGTA